MLVNRSFQDGVSALALASSEHADDVNAAEALHGRRAAQEARSGRVRRSEDARRQGWFVVLLVFRHKCSNLRNSADGSPLNFNVSKENSKY